MEQQQDAAPSSSASPPRTPRKRRLSADASSDKKRRVSSSPSPPRDATLRIVTQTLRDENRQLQQEREALEQDKRALGERLARSQRSLRDLEEDVARVYRQKQQELEAQRRAFEQKLQARPKPAESPASKETSSAALLSQQTTQEMDRFLASCELWQRKLAALDAELAAKARKMETREVQRVVDALVGGVEVDTLQGELQDRQEQLQWARWMQTDAASCLELLHSCAQETEVFEAMEKQLMVDRVVELETQLAQKRAAEREKEVELSSLRADQEELLHSSHVVPNDEFEALLEQKKAMEEQLKQMKGKLKTQNEAMARAEDERASLKQHNQKLLEETRQLREKKEASEFEGMQLSMTQDEEIKKLQAQLQAAKTREEKMDAAMTVAKREIEKLKPRKGELKILYAKFSSAMDSVSEKTMRLEELSQELDDAKANAREIEARNKELEQELQKLRSSARGIGSQNKKLENQVAELQQQVADLSAVQRRDKSVNEELLKVQKQCAELRELESQQKELASKMQSELAALKAQNEALKEQQVKREHQSVGQPSIEGDKSSRDSSSSYAVQVAEKEALKMFVQRYSSAAEAKCNKLLEKVSELHLAKTLIQEQTKETCSVLRMCTQVDSCDESIRASLLDVMATLESLT